MGNDIVDYDDILRHLPALFWPWNLTFKGGQGSYENNNIEYVNVYKYSLISSTKTYDLMSL